MQDNEDYFIQFQVTVDANRESKKKRSSEDSFSINPAIDVSTTITSVSPELQTELLDRLEKFQSGGGLRKPEPGVCC